MSEVGEFYRSRIQAHYFLSLPHLQMNSLSDFLMAFLAICLNNFLLLLFSFSIYFLLFASLICTGFPFLMNAF